MSQRLCVLIVWSSHVAHFCDTSKPSRFWRGVPDLDRGLRTFGNNTTLLTPTERASATASRRPCLHPNLSTPGIESIGIFFSPSCMNTGKIRLAGVMKVSDIAPRMVGLRRLRLGRDKMSCNRSTVQRTHKQAQKVSTKNLGGIKSVMNSFH
jgi:hypothetical protein